LRLTQREAEIVTAICQGNSNKEIAAKLSISEETVKRHLSNIFEKLGISSRLELAVLANRPEFRGMLS
jgi:DNA-binding NarL/FixJ family response regulator